MTPSYVDVDATPLHQQPTHITSNEMKAEPSAPKTLPRYSSTIFGAGVSRQTKKIRKTGPTQSLDKADILLMGMRICDISVCVKQILRLLGKTLGILGSGS